jgi:integrase
VIGLEVDDVSFERRTVTFRPNARRARLKSATSWRVVPLWPQLEEILWAYLFAAGDAREGLLFPGHTASGLVGDIRKVLDQLAARAGFLRPALDPATDKQRKTKAGQFVWTGRRIRAHMLRHTYCAARLQTLDRGQPVSEYTVAKELGHGGPDLVRRIYGHLGDVRHRADVVEYRVEQHRAILGDRLSRLDPVVAIPGTTGEGVVVSS